MSTWILLRGLARERRHWGRFLEQLTQEMPDARVIAIDLPGNGAFNTQTSPANIIDMAAHCRAEMSRHRLQPPYCLLAISMGAMVATAWAQHYPSEIDACVLINTSFATFSPLHHRLRPRAWYGLLRLLVARNASTREQHIFRLTSQHANISRELLPVWISIRLFRPVRAHNVFRQLVAAARFRAPWVAPVPTLVLASARDGLVDPLCSREIARRWSCAIAIHPAAGHDLPLDDGEWVARQVRDWAKTVAQKTGL